MHCELSPEFAMQGCERLLKMPLLNCDLLPRVGRN